jgi:hypothetical protein
VRNIIGTLAGKVENGWSYVVLKGHQKGNFQICSLGGDSHNLNAARSRFLNDMEATEKTEGVIARQERWGAVAGRRP